MLLSSLFMLAPCCGFLVYMHKVLCSNKAGTFNNFWGLHEPQGKSYGTTSPVEELVTNEGSVIYSTRQLGFILQGDSPRRGHSDALRAYKKSNQKLNYQRHSKGAPENGQKRRESGRPKRSFSGYNRQGYQTENRNFNQGGRYNSSRPGAGKWDNRRADHSNIGPWVENSFGPPRNHGRDRWLTKQDNDGLYDNAEMENTGDYMSSKAYDDFGFNSQQYHQRGFNQWDNGPKRGPRGFQEARGHYAPRVEQKWAPNKERKNMHQSYEDLNAQLSMLNRKLAKENQKVMRITTEQLNPLLKKVAHSNQAEKKLRLSPESQQRIKALTKKGINVLKGKKDPVFETTNGQMYKDNVVTKHGHGISSIAKANGFMQPISKNKKVKVPNTEKKSQKVGLKAKNKRIYGKEADMVLLQDEQEGNIAEEYSKAINFDNKELGMMPIDVPGIRSLNLGPSKKKPESSMDDKNNSETTDALKRKLMQLQTVGYDGIVDLNTLFDSGSNVFHPSQDAINEKSASSTFEALGITNQSLIKALERKGISRATVTQGKYIPALNSFLNNENSNTGAVRGHFIHAPTGSGKTLAYMLPLLQRILSFETSLTLEADPTDRKQWLKTISPLFSENVVVLAPSVELSVQSNTVLKELYQAYEGAEKEHANPSAIPKATAATTKASPGFSDVFRTIGAKILHKIRGSNVGNSTCESNEPPASEETGNIKTSAEDNNQESEKLALKVKVISEIKPILLIGNANVANQKRALRELKEKQMELRKKAIETLEGIYDKGPGSDDYTVHLLHRVVGIFFTTPGRAYSLWKTHKALDIKGTKYCVVDEYDGLLNLKRKRDRVTGEEKKELENPQVEAVIDAMVSSPRRSSSSNPGETASKYVLCLSASRLIEGHSIFRELSDVSSGGVEQESQLDDSVASEYDAPKNILHTFCQYSVPDAKLSLLRKVMRSFPYDKSVLLFCDSNGTAQFLQSYLTKQFPSADVIVLNSRQGKLERKKSFQNVLQSNLETALRGQTKANNGGSVPVRSIVISTQLNSRGIDFSGFSHVIHYDLPHDATTYLHRSGRIGRAGNPGICISMVESKHMPIFQRVIACRVPVDFHNLEVFKGYLCRRPLG